VLNIAHRGASGYAPENTRAAFEQAIEMGADGIETDVRRTSDGELVLMHDMTVSRTTNGNGPVADHTLAELRTLDAGSWFSDDFAGDRIVTLDELIADFSPRRPLILEIKDPIATAPVIDTIRAAGIGNRVQVTSFDWSALLKATSLDPELAYGFLSPVFDNDIIRRCARRGFAQICPNVDTLTGPLVAEAHEAGLVVRAYGVVNRKQIDRLFATGADGATVNWPDWIPDWSDEPSR